MKSENSTLSFQEISKSSGLIQKILYTALLLAVYRFGVHIPLYGVDQNALKSSTVLSSGLLGLVDMFAGGALSALSIFALGIGPYITASIIMQLLVEIIPNLKEMQRNQGDDGRKKFQRITRFGLKTLASGNLSKAVTVKANLFSASAKEAIEKAGGKVIEV